EKQDPPDASRGRSSLLQEDSLSASQDAILGQQRRRGRTTSLLDSTSTSENVQGRDGERRDSDSSVLDEVD
ncbi:unnamed protein product, partial [Amoebophrya sp. A25]